jgi:hypothetical protein
MLLKIVQPDLKPISFIRTTKTMYTSSGQAILFGLHISPKSWKLAQQEKLLSIALSMASMDKL